ncbi:hypothetical protein JCM10450v2_005293 [Rhodotorula kratochvilovae]
MPPTIDVFVTSILSNPAIRGRHERVRRYLTSARVPYNEHDVAGDEAAKSLWKRKSGNKNELPCLLIDGEPVGSIEDFDEAVEFGELRQFLRLDGPAPPAVAAPAGAAPSSSSTTPSAGAGAVPSTSADTPASPKPSIDDFASLALSPSELDELAREIAAGETFSSGLGTLSPSGGGGPLNFGSHATRTFEPVLPATQPLKLDRIRFERPLPERPLASDPARDVLEGIDTANLEEDELEALARELEAEEERARSARGSADVGMGVQPPPLPEKSAADSPPSPPLPPKEEEPAPPPAPVPANGATAATALGGDGGAALSAPLGEVSALRLSPRTEAALVPPADADEATLHVAPVSALERAPPLRSDEGEAPSRNAGAGTSKQEAEEIRSELNLHGARAGPGVAVSELPHFGVKDMIPPGEEEAGAEGEADPLEKNVAAAIRGGDL